MGTFPALAGAALGLSLLLGSCGGGLPPAGPLPPGKTFQGVWDSNWGQMQLQQNGSHVHGRYKGFRTGSVSGDTDGNLYLFRWTQWETKQHGRGYMQMSPDGERLDGRWGYGKESTNGGVWWATRVRD